MVPKTYTPTLLPSHRSTSIDSSTRLPTHVCSCSANRPEHYAVATTVGYAPLPTAVNLLISLRQTHEPIPTTTSRPLAKTCSNTPMSLHQCKADTRLYVVKTHPHSSASHAVLRQLRDNMSTTHHNVARIVDVLNTPAGLESLTEYADAGDLHSLVARHSASGLKLPETVLLHFMRQLCEGVDYLHRGPADASEKWCPILHSDIKPENVALVRNPLGSKYAANIKLVDFDLAMTLNSQVQAKARGCTKVYAPPEYPAASTKTDTWGIGATIWYCAAGRAPRLVFDRKGKSKCGHLACCRPAPKQDDLKYVATAATVRQAKRQESDEDLRFLNERHPFCYDTSSLVQRMGGWSCTGGAYSRGFAGVVMQALEQEVEKRPEARELLEVVNQFAPPGREKGVKIARLKRREWNLDFKPSGQVLRREEVKDEGKQQAEEVKGKEKHTIASEEDGKAAEPLTALEAQIITTASSHPEEDLTPTDSGYGSVSPVKTSASGPEKKAGEREDSAVAPSRRYKRALSSALYALSPSYFRNLRRSMMNGIFVYLDPQLARRFSR